MDSEGSVGEEPPPAEAGIEEAVPSRRMNRSSSEGRTKLQKPLWAA
jgi:hypothetical protein